MAADSSVDTITNYLKANRTRIFGYGTGEITFRKAVIIDLMQKE